MIKFNQTLIVFSILLISLSCKSKKNVVSTINNPQEIISDNKVNDVVQKHYANTLNFTTASIRTSAEFQDSKKSVSVGADIRIKKDEIIWINLKVLGLPMGKALITPTRVSYYEKLNGTYFDGDYTILSNLVGTELNYQKVQNILLGRPIDNLMLEDLMLEVTNTMLQLKSKKTSNFQKIFSFESASFLLQSQYVNQISKSRNVLVNYTNYQNINTNLLPSNVSIVANQKDQVKINVEYKKITLNEDLSFPYVIPDGYTQIKID